MCSSFLPLPLNRRGGEPSGLYLQLFISHNKGCQYYIGDYDREQNLFHPLQHGRMSWQDNAYFAPEALIDGRGRQIMWAWLLDNPHEPEDISRGWSGVYGLPRVLWLSEDQSLRMAPADELHALRCNEQLCGDVEVGGGQQHELPAANGMSCEVSLSWDWEASSVAGLIVCASLDGQVGTRIYYDAVAQRLVIDSTASGTLGRLVKEEAPLQLHPGEQVALTVYIDQSVVEVFANDRQAICRRIYTPEPGCSHIRLFAEPGAGTALFRQVTVWEMSPSNPY